MTAPRTLTCDEVRDLAPLFVTGALEPSEMDDLRGHLAGCADPHEEVAAFGEAATALLETVEPVEPPARLKASLLAAAAADLEAGRHPAAAPIPAVPDRPANVVDLRPPSARRGPRLAWMAAAAAIVVALVLGGANLALRRDLDTAQAYRDGVAQALELAATPGSTTALLASEDGTVAGFGVLGADGTVRLAVKGLDATTGTQVYTAWAIEADGAPVPIGEFTAGADGVAVATASAPGTEPGATLALTLEPAPGATTPTLPIVAAGATRELGG